MNRLKTWALLGLALPLATQAWMFPASVYPKPAGKYTFVTPSDSASMVSSLKSGWASWKSKFVNSAGYVSDPSGFTPNSGRVSEGVGYGMLLAVLNNDSATFRSIWFNAEKNFWYTYSYDASSRGDYGWYGWQSNSQTNVDNMWGAPDADEDVALALIFASALARMKHWPNYTYLGTHKRYDLTGSVPCTLSLDTKVRQMLISLERLATSTGTGFPRGDYFQHNTSPYAQRLNNVDITLQNLSYFSPAWYRVFMNYTADNAIVGGYDWSVLMANQYGVVRAQPNASKGMARDWSLHDGKSVQLPWMSGSLFGHVADMWYDAIRVPYRLGMAAYWFKDTGAVRYCKSVWDGGLVKASTPRMYTGLDGSPSAQLPGLEITPRSMWAVSAYGGRAAGHAASTTAASTFHTSMKGTSYGSTNQYFDESLGLLGGLVAAGCFPNIWDDLKGSFPDTSPVLKTFTRTITGNKSMGVFPKDSVLFSASFDKSATCTLVVTGKKTGALWKGTFKTTGAAPGTLKWKMGVRSSVTGTGFDVVNGEYVKATLRWSGTVPSSARNVLDSIPMCGSALCPDNTAPLEIAQENVAKGWLKRMPGGSLDLHEPWFPDVGPVKILVRDASGKVLLRRDVLAREGVVSISPLNSISGWVTVEAQARGHRSVQTLSLSR